jgi:hypothetical protein
MVSYNAKKIFKSHIFIIFIIFYFSFFLNRHFGNIGVFPIDTFLHYDSGYRILKNQYPARDFWVTSGILTDFLEAGFFKLLGLSWDTHIFHSSFINGIISVASYFVLINLRLDKYYSLTYSLCFSVLAYTVSGTPFVDHHATFFLLLATYSFILAIVTQKKIYWIIAPWFFGFSLLNKQVPAAYLVILFSIILSIYFYLKKDIKVFLYIFFSTLVFLVLSFLSIEILGLNNIYVQYFLYPQTIGLERLENLKNIKLISFFNHYKFILIPLFTLLILNVIRIIKKKSFLNTVDFFIFLLIFSYSLAVLFHQILTKNQIYIYFLCPLLLAFINIFFFKKYKKVHYFLLILCFFITIKFHFEFNENRKFHDLKGVNLKNSISASLIDDSLKGLNWISLAYKDNPSLEINRLHYIIDYISRDKNPKILITHYLFLSSLIKGNIYTPSRAYTLDGVSFPLKGNKYYNNYSIFFTDIVNKNNIKFIYLIKEEGISEAVVTNYLDNSCFIKKKNSNLIIFEILKECVALYN